MREIKFRAFHKPSKIMYWFDLMWGNNGHGNGWIGMVPFGEPMTNRSHRDNVTNVDPTDCDIMQFIGLKDINGTDIYEGDACMDRYGAKSKMVYVDELAAFMDSSSIGIIHPTQHYMTTDQLVIIGNIHQNPELL